MGVWHVQSGRHCRCRCLPAHPAMPARPLNSRPNKQPSCLVHIMAVIVPQRRWVWQQQLLLRRSCRLVLLPCRSGRVRRQAAAGCPACCCGRALGRQCHYQCRHIHHSTAHGLRQGRIACKGESVEGSRQMNERACACAASLQRQPNVLQLQVQSQHTAAPCLRTASSQQHECPPDRTASAKASRMRLTAPWAALLHANRVDRQKS